MSDNSSKSGGVSVLGLLGVAFVILKLCKVIAWSWWWVLCPFWGFAIFAVIFAALFAIYIFTRR